MPKALEEKESKIKPNIFLQCPVCRHLVKESDATYRCPIGHGDLNTTPEGYPILKEIGSSIKPLQYGVGFKEGVFWQKVINRCQRIVYVKAEEDGAEVLKPLIDYLVTQGRELTITSLDELNRLKMDTRTPIIFSQRIGRKNGLKVLSRYLRNPVYQYLPGSVVPIRLSKLIQQGLSLPLNQYLIDPIVSHGVEVCYERYLSDIEIAKQFARTYFPSELQNGKDQHAFDFGCGRGRHVAMLSQLGFHVTGMDLQPHPFWKKMPEATFIVGTADSLSSIPDEVFDLALCMQVLMYIVDDHVVLAHLRRILKRGGRLLLQVTNKENLRTRITKEPLAPDPYLIRYYRQSELCHQVKRCGFEIDRVWTEKFYAPFFTRFGNILYEFIMSPALQGYWDRLFPSRYLGLINILAKPV